jgi:DNA topoisomerase III
MKTLIITEKPSVAKDVAAAIGRFSKEGDHYENDQFIVAAAAGHLVELFMPEDIDAKRYKFWQLRELPIIPEPFQVKPIADKRNLDRFNALKKLLARKDVDRILNACDAGREGELIFTYIYEACGCKKPFERIWMQSMTKASIRTAFEQPRSRDSMQGLQDAARSRSEADWLIGINGTRAVTKRMFGRGKGMATVGRVQTPTLSIVYRRELEIRNFKSRPFWKIVGSFQIASGRYEATLQRSEPVNKADSDDKADRLWSKPDAERLVAMASAAPTAVASDVCKRTRQAPARLFDLTSLQREANGKFGYSAARTLQIAQSLYEKHKALTYPRTDSRALPEDYVSTVRDTLQSLDAEFQPFAAKILANGWLKPDKRIFNNSQVSDHFAIIPTGETPGKLSPEEARIYDLVTRRFLSVFFPAAEFDVTTRTTLVGTCKFQCEGKVMVAPGWMEIYGREALDQQMPPLGEADRCPAWVQPPAATLPANQGYAKPLGFDLREDVTKPPARFTEATLLSAMEGAGKLVEDDEMAEAMKEKGLGTPATRAATIDHLVNEKYLERDGRALVPTDKAGRLFEFLEAIQVDSLTRPDLTGEWEHKLLLMEKGQLSRADFIRGIHDLTRDIVDKVRNFTEVPEDAVESSIISPSDSKPLREMLRAYQSQDGVFTIYKTIAGRKLEPNEIQALLSERCIGPLDGFRSKMGKPFRATLRLDAMNKVTFEFPDNRADNGGDNADGTPATPIDPATLPVIGVFQETGESVYETDNGFMCARALRGERDGAFRISRLMLGKPLPREEIQNLLTNGKTGLITGFLSRKTGRKFDAFLLLKPQGAIGFEFPPRAPAKDKKKSNTGESQN